MKKELYFVQPNSMLGNSVYFPYAAGVLSSYALQFEDVKNAYELCGIVFKEDAHEDVFKHLKNPSVIGFSNYFWNYKYNLALASEVKKRFPDCTVVFGGHQISHDTEWLRKNDFIDLLIFGEGELPFTAVLRSIAGDGELYDIANIAFRDKDGSIHKTDEKAVGAGLYPSPYTEGIFEKLLNVTQGLEFNAQLETNRGCPYHCSFCDWCDYELPMRMFPLERIKADLKWISEHKIPYCMCIDSNFGLFERDEEIAEYAVSLKAEIGYPEKFGACFAKDKTDRIYRINKLFNDAGMSKGVSLAFQSMSEEVLKNVSRSNMNKDKLAQQLALYHAAGIPTYTELILGLPGESLESFSKGICELLELGQHDSINVFRCEVYPNSSLADSEYIKKYGIKTAVNLLNINHCSIPDAVYSGGLEYITETSTMSSDELVNANVFSCCVQSVHCHGLLQCFAIYLHNLCDVSYYDFYSSFIAFFSERDGLIGATLRKIGECIKSTALGKTDLSYINPAFGSITWPYEEAMLLDFIYELDLFYNEACLFLNGYGIDGDVFKELMMYQKSLITVPGENDTSASFKRNWHGFFESVLTNKTVELAFEPCTVRFSANSVPADWEGYARRIIWYGRRNKMTIRKTELL